MADQEADVTETPAGKDPYLAAAAGQPQLGGDTLPSDEPARSDEKRMSFLEHLVELRVHLRNAVLAFLVAMIGSPRPARCRARDELLRQEPDRAILGIHEAGHRGRHHAVGSVHFL